MRPDASPGTGAPAGVSPVSLGSRSLNPPTAEQRRRWERMNVFGCIACRMQGKAITGQFCGPNQRHHLTVGGKHGAPRLGHDFTVMLGAWHHMGTRQRDETGEPWSRLTMEVEFGPSYALTPKAFRREFGSDEELLRYQNELIAWTKEPVRERKRKSRCTASDKQVKRQTGGFA